MTRFEKLDNELKKYLIANNFFAALNAYDFAKGLHIGLRKDGVTPEFQHQIEIALYATTLRGVIDEEKLIMCILLHDAMEDYDIAHKEMQASFGDEVFEAIWCVTKVYQGVKRDPVALFESMAKNHLASMTKGLDRIHNQQYMQGVFSHGKQNFYIGETEDFILPMLKQADRNFPQQHLAYMNVRVMLKSQIALIRAMLSAANVAQMA